VLGILNAAVSAYVVGGKCSLSQCAVTEALVLRVTAGAAQELLLDVVVAICCSGCASCSIQHFVFQHSEVASSPPTACVHTALLLIGTQCFDHYCCLQPSAIIACISYRV
jgi:hypothetical protein